MKYVLLILLIFTKTLNAATITDWVNTPNLGSGTDVADYGTNGNYIVNLIANAEIQNLILSDWDVGITSVEITNTGSPHILIINSLSLAGDNFHIIIGNGVTLIVEGTSTTNGGKLSVLGGGKIIFNNTVSLEGDGLTLEINSGGLIDINSTLNISGGVNILNIDGNLEVNNLVANGGSQQIDIGAAGTVRVINDAAINAGDGGSANFEVVGGGKFLINGDLSIGNTGASYLVNGILAVGGSITGNGAAFIDGTGTIVEGSDANVYLPIELTYFNVFSNKTHITLNWQTATELNNEYFTLERSADGVTYKIIGTVKGAGTSMSAINYSFTDTKPLNGVSYYRLTQTDYDGKFEVFSPVAVSYLNENEIKISSNPSAKEINISMNGEMGKGVANIYNVIGVFVKTIEISDNFTTVNVSDMPKGTYLLVVSANKYQITKRIMVQ